jgi:CTP-dependent riboflavin kinase
MARWLNQYKRNLRDEVLEYLREYPERRHTSYSLANALGCSSNNNTARALRRLKEEGLVTWEKGHFGAGAKLTGKGKTI